MNPDWHKQVLPGWTKYIFYAFLILCAIYFLWPWGLSITWQEWLGNWHQSQRNSRAASLQNSPVFKARFKGVKILVQEPFTLHVQGSPTQWLNEPGATFLVENKKKAPSGIRYLTVAVILESQRKQNYDPPTMGPTFQELIDTVEGWDGIAEFAKNTKCQYGLIMGSSPPKGSLFVTLSPSLKPKDGKALFFYPNALRNDVHLALTNGQITSARLPLKESWNQIPEVAAYEKALMGNGLEPDPEDYLVIAPEHRLSGHPKGTKGDEFNMTYHGNPNMLERTWWTERDVTLEKQDQAYVDTKLNEDFMRGGLSREDIQGHLTRTSLRARHEPRWMGGTNGPIDRGKIQLNITYRYRTERTWIDTLRPSFQLEPVFLPDEGSLIQIDEMALKPLQKAWLIDEGQAKWILASQGADTVHFAARMFVDSVEQSHKGFLCLESRVPKPPPPPLKPGEMRCIWDPYRTLWLDLETGKVTLN